MKNFNTVLLGLLAVVVFAFNTVDSKAQCAPGWTSATRVIEISSGTPGCSLSVNICYMCSPFGGSPSTIKIAGWTQTGNCDGVDFSNDDIITKLIEKYNDLCTTPDCDFDCLKINFEFPTCRQWYYNYQPPGAFYAYS